MIKVNEQKKDMDKIIRESKQVKIEIYEALNKEFRDDFSQWGAELDQKTLSVRFKEPDVLFKPNSSRIEEKFIVILDDFFPRYLKVLNNPKFKEEIQKHIGQSIDTQEMDREHTGLQDRLKQVTGAKNKLANQMDNLSVSDKHYDKKYEDMQVRLDKLYDEIEEIETYIEAVETRLYNIKQE